MKNFQRYKKMPGIEMPKRSWPANEIRKAPKWCSVDLRDGNQALEIPMTLDQKLKFFQFLVDLGFKTIEIGFPAASETEYDFCRHLIDNNLIPDDVAIQVLTQSRQHIIEKTMDALRGSPRAVVHLYNSTSTLQRDVVFNFGKKECVELAVSGAEMIKEAIKNDTSKTKWICEYSPESFSGTEPDFAVEICDAVLDVWQPTDDNKAIVNLPGTVELSTPNVFADQVEYFCTNTRWRSQIEVSIHPHNDRGTAVAATELGMMAGADRVEGTLFGNGERTGNADIVTLAMNLYMHGIDPELDFSDMDKVVAVYEECTGLQVHVRHPWAGKLVFTAFSGSHQDAINKGMRRMKTHMDYWEVPYLPIDPMDVGRSYDPIIRINSQSGKGGVAYLLEQKHGVKLPKPFQVQLSAMCTKISDSQHCELSADKIFEIFDKEFVNVKFPYALAGYREDSIDEEHVNVDARIIIKDNEMMISGSGNGLLDAFCDGIHKATGMRFGITMYEEHAMESGSDSAAITYVEITDTDNKKFYGAGISSSVTKSSLRAVVSAMNRMIREKQSNNQTK